MVKEWIWHIRNSTKKGTIFKWENTEFKELFHILIQFLNLIINMEQKNVSNLIFLRQMCIHLGLLFIKLLLVRMITKSVNLMNLKTIFKYVIPAFIVSNYPYRWSKQYWTWWHLFHLKEYLLSAYITIWRISWTFWTMHKKYHCRWNPWILFSVEIQNKIGLMLKNSNTGR